jgi:hypothetical protein
MAITAANAVYVGGNAPTVTGECKARMHELDFVLVGQASIVGVFDDPTDPDADFDVNWIDGTKTVSPTPTKVFAMRIGGDATATISVVSCTSITNQKFLCTLSAPPVIGTTVIIAFFAAR